MLEGKYDLTKFEIKFEDLGMANKTFMTDMADRAFCCISIRHKKDKSNILKMAYYKSSGTNAKCIDGNFKSKKELEGKWFLIYGLDSKWIHKVPDKQHDFSTQIAEILEGKYQEALKEFRVCDINKEGMDVINKIQVIPPLKCIGDINIKQCHLLALRNANILNKKIIRFLEY